MKYRIFFAMIAALWLLMGIVGMITRRTFTDVTGMPEYMANMYVAQMGQNSNPQVKEDMLDKLKNTDMIFTVTPISERQYFFNSGCQECEIVAVHKGINHAVGDIIRISYKDWSVVPADGKVSVQCGYVNVMKPGMQYVVFLEEPYDAVDRQPIYPFCTEDFFTPAFCTKALENTIIPIGQGPSYVPYAKVQNNEFFVFSEEALRDILEIKRRALAYALGF